ncbi:MAG: metallophosphoesterase [Planctomycetaceae bacterium]
MLVGSGLAVAVPAIAAVDGFFITPRRLVTTTHAFGEPAGAGPAVRIAQVTDLHMARMAGLHEKLLEELHAAAPAILLLTGDLIERDRCVGALEAFLQELPDVPTFAILGNWEYWSGLAVEGYRRLFDDHSIELLVNRSVEFKASGRTIRITGLDDLVAGHPDPQSAVADAEPCPNHLLLAHCPASRDACPLPADHRPSLILSGHTHGGQVAPFGCAIVRPWGSGPYLAGWYRNGGPPLYVSRGIGTSLMPVRIGATPELAVFDWSLS